uniref:PAP/OAS1 substrate-binding-related domain-containing protein n=1 Tax=Oryza brachyantha TaxID=4533 RepID=J3LNK0_ORYBR
MAVFAYGSVPLKTYLPDGDIDLTVLGNTSYGSTLIDDIYYILQSEEQNSDAEFEVKDLQLINAEVRLIKCTIENIVVDISFNQTGGICALCFLELVDRKVGKKHLLKRSIILIKAWCYYESRLLGAHHGLISTYALETLILYIFNLFHKSLHGPLEVLYRFLEYFSKFDWDNYCISLNGPVALSSLPNQIVEAINTPGGDLLFDKEFLKNSVQKTSPKDTNACYNEFRAKYLNIIDPLKEHNNLGRSVNRASFNRIRTAFSYGAQKLGKVLLLQPELIPDEIYGFFKNTLDRIGSGVRPDIDSEIYDDAFHCEPSFRTGTGKTLWEEMSSMRISCKNQDENSSPHHFSKILVNKGSYATLNAPTHLAQRFHSDHMISSSTDLSINSSCFVHHTPNQYPLFSLGNGNGGSEQYMYHGMVEQVSCCTAETCHVNEEPSMHPQVHPNNIFYLTLNNNLGYSKSGPSDKMITAHHEERQNFPPLSSLVDLSGDLDLQLRCLRQVQYHLEYMFDGVLQSVQETSSDFTVVKELFDTPTLNIVSNTDVLLPGRLSPSTETDERRLSPVSSSHSTEDFSQQSQEEDNWGVACQQNVLSPSGIIALSNGLPTPSSSYADSENYVQWYHRSDDIPSMQGTVPHIFQKNMASSGENTKTLISRPVRVKSIQASVPKGIFFTYKEQLAKETANKDIKLSQVQDNEHEYIVSNKKIVGNNCETCIEYIKPENEASQIPRHYKHVRSSKNSSENRIYDTDMGFAQSVSTMNQMPKYQPLKNQDMPNECICPTRSLTRNQSNDIRKECEVFNWPRKQMPSGEPQNSLRGRAGSNKKLAAKQINNNHKEHLSFVTDTEQMPENQANSNKEAEIVGKCRLSLPPVQFSHHNNNGKGQTMLTSSTVHPSFPVTKGYSQSGSLEIPPLDTIEFGTLGPISLTLSPKSNKPRDTLSTSKTCADAAALALQSHPTQSRSPGFYKVGDEEHFPPLRAGTR